jgi:hypothetical protein
MKHGLMPPYEWDETDRSPDSLMALADVLLDRSDAYLQSTLNDTDQLDAKALHLTVGDIAAFAILVGFKKSWIWVAPEVFLALAATFFFLVYKPRNWEIGPDLETFRPPDGPLGPSDAVGVKRAMADRLLWACVENEKVLGQKSRYLTWGYRLLGVGLALAFVLTLITIR